MVPKRSPTRYARKPEKARVLPAKSQQVVEEPEDIEVEEASERGSEMADDSPQVGQDDIDDPALFVPRKAENSSTGRILPARDEASRYPRFDDGDVLISSTTGRCWKLHSTTLRNASRFFFDLLKEDSKSSKRWKKDDPTSFKWKIHMIDSEKFPLVLKLRSFKLVEPNAKNRSDLANFMEGRPSDAPFNHIYDNLFRCIYNLDPKFNRPVGRNIDPFILDATSLLQAAEHIEAGPAVSLLIEAHFLRLGQLLWKHVAKNAVAWADISLRLQSSMIFRTAMAHLAGRWDLWGPDGVDKEFLKTQPNGDLLTDLATRKASELKEAKLQAERLLMEFYPQRMWHEELAGKETYATDIYYWQALNLVRQYFSSCMLANMHHRSCDGGAYFYGTIGEGTDAAYLGDEAMQKFWACFNMTSKGQTCLTQAVAWMKDEVKPIVGQLMVDQSNISRKAGDPAPNYLTCSVLEDEELPWAAGVSANFELHDK